AACPPLPPPTTTMSWVYSRCSGSISIGGCHIFKRRRARSCNGEIICTPERLGVPRNPTFQVGADVLRRQVRRWDQIEGDCSAKKDAEGKRTGHRNQKLRLQ